MEILFVVENISEKCGANVNIILNLIKKIGATNNVSVLTKTNELKRIDEKKAKSFCECISFYSRESEYLLEFQKTYSWNKQSNSRKLLLMLMHPMIPIYMIDVKYFDSWLTRRAYKRKIENVCKMKKYDAVIAVSAPYYLARVVTDSKITSGKVIFQLDPYSYNYTMPQIMINRRRKIEKKVIERVDKVFAASFVYDEMQQKGIVNDMSKITSFMLPGILTDEIQESKITLQKEGRTDINFVFVGQFYDKIRNPQYLLELFAFLPDNYILHIFGGGADNVVDKYRDNLGRRLVCHGWVSAEEARRQMYDADILVNVNNTISNQMASKLFEYIGTGKPILNICKAENCSSLAYSKRYPLCMNVIETFSLDNTMVNQVIGFVKQSKGKVVSKENILKNYTECTDDFVASILINELEML